jgi:hypothetical protein
LESQRSRRRTPEPRVVLVICRGVHRGRPIAGTLCATSQIERSPRRLPGYGSDLDEETEGDIMSRLSTVHRESGVTIPMVMHTKQLVAYDTRHVEVKAGALGAGAG